MGQVAHLGHGRGAERGRGAGHDPPQGHGREGDDVQQLDVTVQARADPVVRAPRARGGEQRDGLLGEASHGEPQGARGEVVQPRQVVHGDDDRALGGERAQLAQDPPGALEERQVGVQGGGLRVPVEEVEQPLTRAVPVVLRRPCHQDPRASGPATLDAVGPEGRLADPRLADE